MQKKVKWNCIYTYLILQATWHNIWHVCIPKMECDLLMNASIISHSEGLRILTYYLYFDKQNTKRPVSKLFSPSGEQAEQRILAYKQPTACCIAIFHKYCCFIRYGGIKTNVTPWGISLICQNASMRVCGAWIKIYSVYVKKHITHLAACYGPPLVRDEPLGASAFVVSACCVSSYDKACMESRNIRLLSCMPIEPCFCIEHI